MRIIQSLVLLVMALMSSVSVYSAPGDLDTTFGGGKGWVNTGLQRKVTDDRAEAMVQQVDGKIVVVGSTVNGGNDFAIARYSPDGSLDSTFGNNGKVTTDLFSRDNEAKAVIQQSDSKLVVGGNYHNGNNRDIVVARYTANGTLDTSFMGGTVVLDLWGDDELQDVTQQLDGKLVIAGLSYGDTQSVVTLVRIDSDGFLDASFGNNGIVTLAVGSFVMEVNDLFQQPDGKFIICGAADNQGDTDIFVIRFNADGSLDSDFGGTGYVITDLGSTYDTAKSVLLQIDGKIIVAGSNYLNNKTNVTLVRYSGNGTLDLTFGNQGQTTTDLGNSSEINQAIFQSDGKIILVGSQYAGANTNILLIRFESSGVLDAAFSGDGWTVADYGTSYNVGSAVISQADGKVIVAGFSDGGIYNDFALLRFNIDGNPDISFDQDGKLLTNFSTSDDYTGVVIQQADGKLVQAGSSGEEFSLVRYNPDGTLDSSFDNDGIVLTAIGPSTDSIRAVIQQTDGKLVAAGWSYVGSGAYNFSVARYLTNGMLDTSFNGSGKVTTAIRSDIDKASSIIQQADGKLVVAGSSRFGSDDFAIVRYTNNGALDTSFGGTGKVITSISSGSDLAQSIIQQSDGKLVVAGYSWNGSNHDIAVARYNLDGTLDTIFSGDGIMTANFGSSEFAYSVIQQKDGNLLIGGEFNNHFGLLRCNPDGTLDSSFDSDGKVITTIATTWDSGRSVVQQSDGKLLLAGWSAESNTCCYENFSMARYNLNGSLDSSFSSDGKVALSISSSSDISYSVIQQRDGKVVLGGYSNNMPTGNEFVVVRFESGQLDTDSDGYVDWLDTDNDNDGVLNSVDTFPLNPAEWLDTDSDTIGNNADWDDDGDGVPDTVDAAPLDNVNTLEIVLPLNGIYKGSLLKNNLMAH